MYDPQLEQAINDGVYKHRPGKQAAAQAYVDRANRRRVEPQEQDSEDE